MLTITFGLHVFDSSSLVSVLFKEAFSHPYISLFHLLVNGFSVTSFHIFSKTPYLLYSGGRGGIKMVPANTQSANKPARTLFYLVHTVQLKPTIKAQISGRMASNRKSDVVTASVYLEKTCLKKLMIMMKMIIITEKTFTSK